MMCTCAVHCPERPYHERACCDQLDCDCWCHGPIRVEFTDREGRKRFSRFHSKEKADEFASNAMKAYRRRVAIRLGSGD